ncbi:hypothetical protein [Marinimicrobium locisalis]|uniref:hypothetical protein n=1 Tax=Marinimicrobium locisalis TaxID=546022 RepID=UPI003221F8E4
MEIETLSKEAHTFWDKSINQDVWEFVKSNATTSVMSRIESCYRHFTKALVIKDIDPEMSAIRLIAAEEELTVAVFDIIKRNEDSFVECKHITKKFRNHYVKQLFSPTVNNIALIIYSFLKNGMRIDASEDAPSVDVSFEPIIAEDKVLLRLHIGDSHIDNSPFNIFLSKGDEVENVVEFLYEDFKELIRSHGYSSVKEFATHRVDFRNKILYAEDAMIFNVGEQVENVLSSVTHTLNQVLWVIALLLSNDDSPAKKWGISGQFLRLYEHVLKEAKVI